jgi:hypothetical protein
MRAPVGLSLRLYSPPAYLGVYGPCRSASTSARVDWFAFTDYFETKSGLASRYRMIQLNCRSLILGTSTSNPH